MKIICMIPARMGSVRCPMKNIRMFNGKPLVVHSIKTAIQSQCFAEIWLNSESSVIGQIAIEKGIQWHNRPDILADNNATSQHFVEEFLRKHDCDYVVMFDPTSPLVSADTVKHFCSWVSGGKYDTILSVEKIESECFLDGTPINFEIDKKTNSQDLTSTEKITWALTAWRKKSFLKTADKNKCGTYNGNVYRFVMPKMEAFDINTETDFDIAEAVGKGMGVPEAYMQKYIYDLNAALNNIEITCRNKTPFSGDINSAISKWSDYVNTAKKHGASVWFCGNGASAAMASHMAIDCMKIGKVRSVAPNDIAAITAIANDIRYEDVFSFQIDGYNTNQYDVLVAISSSGESKNILNAVGAARKHRMSVVTLSAMNKNNTLRNYGDINFYVPVNSYGLAESSHQAILHGWFDNFVHSEGTTSER